MQLLVNKLGDDRASGTLEDPIIDPAQIRSRLPLSLHMFNQQFSLRLTLFHVFDVSRRSVPETVTNIYQGSRLRVFPTYQYNQYQYTPCDNIGVFQGCQGPHWKSSFSNKS